MTTRRGELELADEKRELAEEKPERIDARAQRVFRATLFTILF